MTIGYTAGVFDLFHIGHLTLLKNAKGLCDKLIVGVTVDELVTYKGKRAIIPFSDRIEIVRSIKYVDAAVPQYDMDKLAMCKKLGASILFVGDDWYGTDKWREYEKEFAEAGVRAASLPRRFPRRWPPCAAKRRDRHDRRPRILHELVSDLSHHRRSRALFC